MRFMLRIYVRHTYLSSKNDRRAKNKFTSSERFWHDCCTASAKRESRSTSGLAAHRRHTLLSRLPPRGTMKVPRGRDRISMPAVIFCGIWNYFLNGGRV